MEHSAEHKQRKSYHQNNALQLIILVMLNSYVKSDKEMCMYLVKVNYCHFHLSIDM